ALLAMVDPSAHIDSCAGRYAESAHMVQGRARSRNTARRIARVRAGRRACRRVCGRRDEPSRARGGGDGQGVARLLRSCEAGKQQHGDNEDRAERIGNDPSHGRSPSCCWLAIASDRLLSEGGGFALAAYPATGNRLLRTSPENKTSWWAH